MKLSYVAPLLNISRNPEPCVECYYTITILYFKISDLLARISTLEEIRHEHVCYKWGQLHLTKRISKVELDPA